MVVGAQDGKGASLLGALIVQQNVLTARIAKPQEVTLEELDIEGNLLSEAAEEAICAAFERNDERRHKLAVAETNIESRFKIESMSRAVTSRAVSRAWMRARSAVIPAEFAVWSKPLNGGIKFLACVAAA